MADSHPSPSGGRRFRLIPQGELTAEQHALAEAIRTGPRAKLATSAATAPGPLGGPFNVWLRSPGVGNLIQKLGEEIRFRSSLPAKLNELAVILTARHWNSQYEWHAHCRLALEAGLDPGVARAIAQRRRPAGMAEDEAIVYEFARELHETQAVSDETYGRALARFGERGVVDLISVIGFYVLVSMCLNVDRTPVPDGAVPFAVPGDR